MITPMSALPALNNGCERQSVSGPRIEFAQDRVFGLKRLEPTVLDQSMPLRRHERVPSNIRAILYVKNRFQSVVLRNISRGGAGIGNCRHLIENDGVTISLLSGRRIEAKVRWWLAGVCGVQFKELLEPADVLLTGRLDYAVATQVILRTTGPSA